MRTLASVLALALAGCALLTPRPVERPNLVVIVADDLGWADLGSYGAPFDETPRMDALARAGLRFTQAYAAAPVCSPTRASLWTGRSPARLGLTDFIPGDLAAAARPLVTPPSRSALPLDEFTVAEALAAAGYQTFYAGKWHLGEGGFAPDAQGFARYVSARSLGNAGDDWRVSDRLTDAAESFIEGRDPARPFFMVLAYQEPHVPILSYPAHIEHFRAKAAALGPRDRPREIAEHGARTRPVQDDPTYASEVAGLDDCVGRLLAKLDAAGLGANTVVFLTSDNGGLATTPDGPGPTSNAPLRAGKGWLYEGGIRVPLIVRGPGIAAGAVSDFPVQSTDLYPTLLDLAGAPPRPEQHVDGRSFAALLRGGSPPAPRPFFWHYPHYHDGSGAPPAGAVRDGRFKLVQLFAEPRVEVYDLVADPGEQRDLAQTRPDLAESLARELGDWRRGLGVTVPQPR